MYLITIRRHSVWILLYQSFCRGKGGFWSSLPWADLINLHPQVNCVASIEDVCLVQQYEGASVRWGHGKLDSICRWSFWIQGRLCVCFLWVLHEPSTASCERFQGWGESRVRRSCILFSGSHVTGPSRPPFPIVATWKLFLFIQKRLRDAGYVDNICSVQIYFIIKIPYNFVL